LSRQGRQVLFKDRNSCLSVAFGVLSFGLGEYGCRGGDALSFKDFMFPPDSAPGKSI